MNFLRLFFILSLSLPLLNCKISFSKRSASYDFLYLASIGVEESTSDSDYFYIDLNRDYYKTAGAEEPLYEISTSERWGDSEDEGRDSVSNCEIFHDSDDDPNEYPTEDMMCIMDIMEQDFYTGQEGNRDLVLQFNVPEGMCTLFRVEPPWHYNQKIGLGYTFIYTCETPDAGGGDDAEAPETRICASNTINGANKGCAILDGSYDSPLTSPSSQDDYVCSEELDATKACESLGLDLTEIGLGNCCFGEYRDETGARNSYSGDFNSCIGGPGRTSWNQKAKVTTSVLKGEARQDIIYENVPAFRIYQVPDNGLKDDIPIKGVLSVTQNRASYPVTNYIEDLDVDPDDLKDVDRKDLHLIFKSAAYFDEDKQFPSPEGNPLWTFSCLDSAGETLHRVHLMIREWNTYEEFNDFYNSGGEDTDADPDVVGEEGDDCFYEDRELFGVKGQCNDFEDLEDFFKRAQNPYPDYPQIRYDEN